MRVESYSQEVEKLNDIKKPGFEEIIEMHSNDLQSRVAKKI